jgi:hypothetical protein
MKSGFLRKISFLVMFTTMTVVLLTGCRSDRKVYFGNLEDGANVESPFKVQMKAENLIVEPAAMGVADGHGHFHILINEPLSVPSEPIMKDATHIHYGNGQTEAELALPVGQHSLILQFAKGDHIPYDPPIYQEIRINVIKENTLVSDSSQIPKADVPQTNVK